MMESDAKLILFNKDTNENFEYDLKGVGEEPLAEEEIYVECRIREPKIVPIKFKNLEDATREYTVTFDLPNASGANKLTLIQGQ